LIILFATLYAVLYFSVSQRINLWESTLGQYAASKNFVKEISKSYT